MTDLEHAQAVAPVKQRVAANGIEMAYLDWAGKSPPGEPARPASVLLHGVLQTGEGMANLAAHLARSGRVVVPDLRGRGATEQPAAGYDPGTMAADVAALIRALGLDRPVVIGRMHGGLVAYHLAASHPELVRGLVLGDTPPEVDEVRAARALGLVRGLPPRFAALEEAIAFYQDTLGLSEARARHDIPHDLVPDETGGYRWRHNLDLIERIETASLPRADWEVLARVQCPTVVLRGQRGEIPALVAERICQVVPDCEVRTILGARHDLFLGPGCEQTFGAIDLFLLRLSDESSRTTSGSRAGEDAGRRLPGEEAVVSGGANGGASAGGEAVGTGAVPPPEPVPAQHGGPTASAQDVVAGLVRAVNSRDGAAFEALFAPGARAVQYAEGGQVRAGGVEAARAAFGRVFSGAAGVNVEVRDVVVGADRIACVFVIQNPTFAATRLVHHPEPRATLVPSFFRTRDGCIVEFVSFHLHVPITQAMSG